RCCRWLSRSRPEAGPVRSVRARLLVLGLGGDRCGAALEQGHEPGLVEDPQAQVTGLGLLRTGVLADDHEIGLLRDGAGGLPSPGDDRLLRAVAGEAVE